MSLPKINLNRHFAIMIVCAVLIFAAGALSNKAYNSHLFQQHVAAAKQQAKNREKKRQQDITVATERAKLRTECDKEVKYYNTLTTIQKKNQPAPACIELLAK